MISSSKTCIPSIWLKFSSMYPGKQVGKTEKGGGETMVAFVRHVLSCHIP